MSDDFLSRWSKRKREVAAEDAAPPEDPPAEAQPDDRPDHEILSALGLKHPDEMGPGDDFAAFMKAAVPQRLRSLALRRLWRTNPTLACLDGLNDYDGDFTGGGVARGDLKTAYSVGRGIVRAALVDGDAEAKPVVEPEAHREESGDDTDREPQDPALSAGDEGRDDTPQPPARRRMKFRT